MRTTHAVVTGLLVAFGFAASVAADAPRSKPILVDEAESAYGSVRTGLASQAALAEAIERRAAEAWERAVQARFEAYVNEHFTREGDRLLPRDKAFTQKFLQQADSYDTQYTAFADATKRVIGSLAPSPAPGGAIIAFLDQPGARETLFASSSGAVAAPRSDPIAQELSGLFSPAPGGGLAIPEEKRAAAQRQLDEGMKLIEAIDKAHARCQRTAARTNGDDDATRRFKKIVSDRTYAAVSALNELKEMRSPDYNEIPRRVSASLKKVLREDGDDQYRLPGGLLRRPVMDSLDKVEAMIQQVDAIRPSVRSVADRLPDTDALHRGWKRMLLDDATLLNLAIKVGAGSAGGAVSTAEFSSTPLGRYIVRAPGGGFRVNRFRANMAASELEDLAGPLRAYEVLAPRFDRLAASMTDEPLRRALESRAVRAVMATAFAAAAEAESRSTESSEQLRVDQDLSRLQEVLASMEPTLAIDLDEEAFTEGPIDLVRSSIFFNPRTAYSRRVYMTEYPDHHAARLFGLFEWNALQSTDLRSYLARLEQEKPRVAELARTHEALVIMINFMPSWLSRSRDDSVLDGHYLARHGSRPRDWGEWERMVIETVRFMEQFKGPQIYYEIWNEPDGYWAEDIDAYLELYERTATAIKKAAPHAKVGGCGINHWKGKVKASPNREPVNVELIRFCGKRNLPLDFVSWHQFTRPVSQITEARKLYEAELRRAGFDRMPEFIVSEWNVAEKGSTFEVVSFAETMAEFISAGVDMQTYASWEEFNADEPDPDSFGPWGLITQKGEKKPPYFVHEFFDRLSRDAKGIRVFTNQDANMRAVVSHKGGGEYEAVVWEIGLFGPRMDAAMKTLAEGGVRNDDLKAYGDLENLELAVRRGRAADEKHARAFEQAKRAYESAPQEDNYLVLSLGAAGRIDLLDSRSVLVSVRAPTVAAAGDRIAIKADRNEVVWLKFRVD